MKKAIIFTTISMCLIFNSAYASTDKTITYVNNLKVNTQAKAITKRAKKGGLIGIHPSVVDDVCDFTKQIFVNNYVSGIPTTVYCIYVGHERKLVNK